MKHVTWRLFRAVCLTIVCWFTGFSHASAQPQDTGLTIAVISDLNSSYGSIEYHKQIPQIVSHIASLQPDLVISTGDMIAGQRPSPLLKRPQLETMWASFHENVSNPLARAQVPFAITAGNHDASRAKKFDLEREIYREQWQNRVPDVNFIDQSQYPFYYAFEVKDVLFIALDATQVGHLYAQQFTWLEGLLDKAKGKYRQRIAFSHLPIWPFAQNRERDIIGDPKLESLLQSNHVALYLSGHHHAFYPGYKDGMLHVSQACLGSGLRKYIGSEQRSRRGYTLIEIDARNRIHIRAYDTADLDHPIDFESLPAQIKSKYALLIREDLARAAE